MNREELVLGLKKILIDQDTIEQYKGLESAEIKPTTDEYGIKVISFYKTLNQEQRDALFTLVKQIRIDTVASFFAFLDGSFWIEGQTEDMKLVNLENPNEKLNEDLTDLFLNLIYNWKQ